MSTALIASSEPKPFWQTLKWMLSVLMVLLFFLDKIPLSAISGNLSAMHESTILGVTISFSEIEVSLLRGILLGLNMVLIPMFIFIAAYLSQGSTIKEINHGVLPAFITYSAFQLLNTIPLLLEGHFSWLAFFLSPLDGVWFILAVPFWQWFSLWLSGFNLGSIAKVLLFLGFLAIGFLAFYKALPYTGFALVIGYYPIFYLGRQVSHHLIARWRGVSWVVFIGFLLAVLALFMGSFLRLPMSESLIKTSGISATIALLNYLLFMLFSILLGMIAIYLIRYLKVLEKIAPKALGIYLIHPIICTGLLAILHSYGITINLLLALGLTGIAVIISLLLASIMPFKWLLAPKFS
ncbi:hypothetical protein MMG00_09185 [Ignatzschineria rhizosphaerae]|uniref:Acyltransferase 3 domain-containing protein n=1 Tax=Ignatzschineria rhizosphaerae TaxID=2923279 RepID=A0ABY3WXR3_9GAMM|nr:hypothetical protein [Ignatzschineria rhizosphaerae]UNM95399.1 hypothetical protein MMG00_09185 [Ignatzschineria rhizosphaerae]